MDRKAIKAKAKEFAFGHKWAIWKPILVVALISGLISGVVNAILRIDPADTNAMTLLTLVMNVLLCVLNVGEVYYIRKVIHEKDVTVKEDLFHFFPKYIGVVVPYLVFTVLCGISTILAFVLPAQATWAALITLVAAIAEIIFALMFAQVPLILAEDKEENYGGITALKMSKEMMDGYKWDYFCLLFSYIGWIILCFFIIPIIWVVPWIITARIMYYEELKKVQK